MALAYTIVDLPPVWPGVKTLHRRRSPFKVPSWPRIEQALAREVRHLGGRRITLALELRRGAADLRQDGKLRADARPGPAVILGFLDSDGQQHNYPLDRFANWEHNLYAIARSLENLRAVERWGFSRKITRAAFLALPGAGASTATLSLAEAASIIASHSDFEADRIVRARDDAGAALRVALSRTHPDRHGGDRTHYDFVTEARKVILAHHGGAL